jgi:hypothetical protein
MLIFTFLFFFYNSLLATTDLKLWVNDVEADVLQQGDSFAWEFDVSVFGGEALIQIYIDSNADKILDSGDILLEEFFQADGVLDSDEGDSSSVQDGSVFSSFGIFGIAPGNYIFNVIDDNDQTSAFAPLAVNALPNPAATITGTLSIEGVSAPSPELENFHIGAETETGLEGIWSGTTDQNGSYEINLPGNALGNEWQVLLFFDGQISGFIEPEDLLLTVQAGVNSGFDLFLALPNAFLYGDLLDENGVIIDVNGYGDVIRLNDGQENEFMIDQGHFTGPVDIPGNERSGQFFLRIGGEGLNPEYLSPSQENQDTVLVSKGDSTQNDIKVYKADNKIYAKITKEGGLPGESFKFFAYSSSFGANESFSDGLGVAELKIKAGDDYYVNIQTDPDYGTPLPTGFILEGPKGQTVSAGDTVHFNLIPTVTDIQSRNENIPATFFVKQNYPNPFNPQTTIEFGLSSKQRVIVEIFDITGKLVQTVVNNELNAGVHRYLWNAEGFSSGMYLYRVSAGKQTIFNKLILLK